MIFAKILPHFFYRFCCSLFSRLRSELRFFVPFLFVGTGGFLVDAFSLILLIELFQPASVGETLFLRCFGFSLGVLFTWLGNKHWTFRDRKGSGSLLFYYPLMVLGALINLSAFTLCLLWLPLASRYPVIAVAFGTVVALFVNFASMRFLVFRRRTGERRG